VKLCEDRLAIAVRNSLNLASHGTAKASPTPTSRPGVLAFGPYTRQTADSSESGNNRGQSRFHGAIIGDCPMFSTVTMSMFTAPAV
jgi:hypothetical protein